MRTIKFRAIGKGGVMRSWEDLQNIHVHTLFTMSQPELTLMQYTGRKDIDGKDIYDGDVLEATISEKKPYTEEDGEGIEDWNIVGKKYHTGKSVQCIWTCEYVDWSTYTGFRFYGLDRRFNTAMKGSTISNCSIKVIGNIHQNPELLEPPK